MRGPNWFVGIGTTGGLPIEMISVNKIPKRQMDVGSSELFTHLSRVHDKKAFVFFVLETCCFQNEALECQYELHL